MRLHASRVATVTDGPELRSGLLAGGAPVMWERAFRSILPEMKKMVPAGSRVLEIGFGDGLLSCYLHRNLGWQILGLDVSDSAYRQAVGNAARYGISEGIEFRRCMPDEVWSITDRYDAVFIKTVLYSSVDVGHYEKWLDWIHSVLKPGGVFIDFETGRANALTQLYRRLRGREYTDLCLFTGEIQELYDARFDAHVREYFGGLSQFFSPIKPLYYVVSRVEEALKKRNADNSFIAAMIYRRPEVQTESGGSTSSPPRATE